MRLRRLELRHRVAEQELYALALDVLLNDGRRDLGQNVRQDARRKVDNGQLGNALIDALGALEADKACAYDEHALVVLVAKHFVQVLRVVERHEARFVLDRVQTLHRGNERTRAGADAQAVVGNGLAAFEGDGLLFGVDVLHRLAEHGGHIVLLVEVLRAVPEHFLLGGFAEQHIGNERTAVNVIRFGGDDRDGADLVRGADALDGADRCGAVADDYVFHSAHLSS